MTYVPKDPNPQLTYLTITIYLIVGIKVTIESNSDTAICNYIYLYSCHCHHQVLFPFSSQILLEQRPSLNLKCIANGFVTRWPDRRSELFVKDLNEDIITKIGCCTLRRCHERW